MPLGSRFLLLVDFFSFLEGRKSRRLGLGLFLILDENFFN